MAVKPFLAYNTLAPDNNVLENTLIELMKDIRGEDAMNVGEWEILPERLKDTTSYILFHTLLGELRS
jgi:hypothetical protein